MADRSDDLLRAAVCLEEPHRVLGVLVNLYRVSRWRLQMYETEPILVLPAKSQKAACAIARLLVGPGTWQAGIIAPQD